jgi:hypothetical protein
MESLLEKQSRENKEPTAQFYGVIIPVSYKINDALTILKSDSSSFLIQNFSDPDYPSPNINLLELNRNSLNAQILDLKVTSSVDLIIQSNFFARSSANSFPNNFSFDLYLSIFNVTGYTTSDYIPILQIKLGKINYDSATNQFSRVNQTTKYILSDINLSFDPSQEKTTKSEYDKIINGESKISIISGFNGSTLTAAQKQYMFNNRSFFNETSVIFLYKGLTRL